MSSPNYDRIIAQEKKVLLSIREHGDQFIPKFKNTAASYLRDWAIKLVKSYYTEKPAVTRDLGPSKNEQLKDEFKSILARLPLETSNRLDDSQIWLHRIEIPERALSDMTYSYQMEKRSKNAMERALKDLIGPVGALLLKFGYIEVDQDYLWNMTPSGLPHYTEDLPSRGMDYFKALTRLMDQYKDILVEYVYAVQNLRKAEQAQRSSQMD